MAASPPPKSSPTAGSTRVVEYDQYVDEQIRRTARAVRAVDVSQSLLRVISVTVLSLLAVAIVEHWVAPGGLGIAGRYGVFACILLAGIWWLVRDLWPLLSRGINPVYAAQTIEQASPSLKNSLVNLLLFRSHRGQLPSAVYETIEQQAAQRLAGTPHEETVDGRGLIRWGYVLVAVLAIGVVYALVSPKNPFATAARVLLPWAEIAPPTRVQISQVAPGNSEAIRGEAVPVSAAITGLEDDEQPMLVVLSPEGRSGDRRIPMTVGEGLNAFRATWQPMAGSGADANSQATVRYRIEAGDARSAVFRLELLTAPAIAVRSVRYDYPDYTGYLDRTAEGVGDLRAIEGTRVTVFAEANLPIASAQVDFQGDGRPDLKMQTDKQSAEVTFPLSLRDDRRTPRHASYVLRFTSTDDRVNDDPASYKIEVLPDLSPESAILAPTDPVLDVRLDESVMVEIEARDPDFGLDRVQIIGESLGDPVFDQTMLNERHEGRFTARWTFVPVEHDLQAGDVVEYWVAASDVRRPEPNRVVSDRQKFRIVAPGRGEENTRDRGGNRDQQDRGEGGQQQQEQQPGDGQGDGSASQQPGEQGDPSSDANGEGQADGDSAGESSGGEGQQPQAGEEQQQNEGQGQPNGEGAEGGVASNDPAQQGDGESDTQGGAASDNPSGGDDRSGDAGDTAGDARSDGQRGDNPSEGGGGSAGETDGAGEQQSPVSADGDDDGAAFDRIREHLEQQSDGGEEAGQSQTDQPQTGEEQPSGDSANGEQDAAASRDSEPGESASDAQASDQTYDQPSDQQDAQGGQGQDQGGDSRSPAAEQPERQPGDSPGESQPDATNDRKQSDGSTSGENGGDVGGEDSAENSRARREGTGGDGKNQAADQGNGTAGDQGAGEETGRGGQQRESNGEAGNPGDGQAGEGQTELEGQGDQPGGQPGDVSSQQDGQQGSQQGDQQESPANDGQSSGEQSAQPGANGDTANDDQTGNEPAGNESPTGDAGDASRNGGNPPGESGSEPGQPKESGDSSSDGSPQSNEGPPGEQRQPPAENANPGESGAAEGSNPQGGGGGAGEQLGGEPGGDEANLEYARKQTDLVLEQLSEQLQNQEVDQELLDSLGWSEEDLRKFVARWQSRKQASQQRGAEGQRELDDALRSLGLTPPELSGDVDTQQDELRDLRSGRRSTIPAKFRNRLERYNEGVSRGQR